MNSDSSKRSSEADAELEREIRDGRKFSLADAIGRLAGPGMMKGVSPATRKQQAEATIESYLERHLTSPAGALSAVLLRQVRESELLLNNLDQPLVVLTSFVELVLDSDYLLREMVRESDVEWGRVYGERPHFQQDGCPPNEEDPYTVDSVRSMLSLLVQKLRLATEPGADSLG